ncbi:MAG TPA: molybdopterin molybdenumtransferase MoeA, partial [Microvirga sp.]|nr:molybdopterin molybdenumtransferase MoeA [Microvirga sp.]
PLAAPLAANNERRHYVRATLRPNEIGLLEAVPIAETDSNHTSSLAEADALIIQRESGPYLPPGEIVEIIPLGMLG